MSNHHDLKDKKIIKKDDTTIIAGYQQLSDEEHTARINMLMDKFESVLIKLSDS